MDITFKYVTPTVQEEVVNLRREFHKYPEEGFLEYLTSGKIADYLKDLGYRVCLGDSVCRAESRMGMPSPEKISQSEEQAVAEGLSAEYLEMMKGGKTGVIGVYQSGIPGPVTALRFDIDALPIYEKTGKNYASVHKNVMHACGHDGHISVGLLTAKCIMEHKEKLTGEIRIIFQPAEEGCRGSRAIVDNGWLNDVDLFLSGHIGLGCRKPGQIYACNYGFMATSKLNITFHGVSAHAGKVPEVGRNALLAAAVFTTNAYAISRSSKGDTRINIGKFVSGTGRNIIADRAYLEVETRGMDTETNQYMEERIEQIAEGVSHMYGVTYEIERVGSAGSSSCSPELVEKLKKQVQLMSPELSYSEEGSMGASEDVVTMMNRVKEQGGQAAYYMFGTTLAAEHHQDTFDFDEDVLPVMIEFYTRAVLDEENKQE